MTIFIFFFSSQNFQTSRRQKRWLNLGKYSELTWSGFLLTLIKTNEIVLTIQSHRQMQWTNQNIKKRLATSLGKARENVHLSTRGWS